MGSWLVLCPLHLDADANYNNNNNNNNNNDNNNNNNNNNNKDDDDDDDLSLGNNRRIARHNAVTDTVDNFTNNDTFTRPGCHFITSYHIAFLLAPLPLGRHLTPLKWGPQTIHPSLYVCQQAVGGVFKHRIKSLDVICRNKFWLIRSLSSSTSSSSSSSTIQISTIVSNNSSFGHWLLLLLLIYFFLVHKICLSACCPLKLMNDPQENWHSINVQRSRRRHRHGSLIWHLGG